MTFKASTKALTAIDGICGVVCFVVVVVVVIVVVLLCTSILGHLGTPIIYVLYRGFMLVRLFWLSS